MQEYMKRDQPGRGADVKDDGATSVPRTKSIPNVSTDRLLRAQTTLHTMVHTPGGLRAHSDTRRSLIEAGAKNKMVAKELHLRGVDSQFPDCKFCGNPDRLT